MPQENDEVNLLDLFKRVFLSIRNAIQRLLFFSAKNFFAIVIFTALGAGSGFLYYKFAQPIYSDELVLSSNYLQNDYCAEIIQDLQDYVEDKTPELLAQKLEIDAETARSIHKIQYDNFDEKLIEKYKDKDTVVLGLPFRVKIFVKNYKAFEVIEPALLNYFERNPVSAELKNIQMTTAKLMIEKIRKEITALDSLKKDAAKYLIPKGPQNGLVFGQPLDPVTIFKQAMDLYKEELFNSSELILKSKSVRLMSAQVRKKPYWPTLGLSILLFASAGLLLGYGFAIGKLILRK